MHNKRPKIKVCGMAKLEQIQSLKELSVDYIGFIFYPKSPRFVLNFLSTEQIKAIDFKQKVGVFVSEEIPSLLEMAENTGLSHLQLHGDEDSSYLKELREKSDAKLIKVIRIGEQSKEQLQEQINYYEPFVDYLLFDTDTKAFGGSGKTFDWQILDKVSLAKPYFLSGGICQSSAKEISSIQQKPFALDINSRFENKPADKDTEKIKQFISNL